MHDSNRSLGASTQYQTEDRPGLKDGRYVSIAGEVLLTLQASGKRSGDEFSSIDFIAQSVRSSLDWANDLDVEYVLNVLARPTELRLLQQDEESLHVIADKDTNLVEKAAHLSEYRLSRLGRKALAMATANSELIYIEGDVIKLIRALENGRLKQALVFLDRLIDQLRTEQLALISIIEKTAGGRKVPVNLFDDLNEYEATMRRAADMVNKAQGQVDVLARGNLPVVDLEVPFGLVQERVRELRRGIVGYARSLSELASKSLAVTSTSVSAPSFASLALRMVTAPPTKVQTDFILKAMGPIFSIGAIPMGVDFRGCIKAKNQKQPDSIVLELEGFKLPPEDQFIEWMKAHQAEFNERILQGRLTLDEAIKLWISEEGNENDFGCLVAAMTSPDEWLLATGVSGELISQLVISNLPGMKVMHSEVALQINKNSVSEEKKDRDDTL